MNVLLLLAEVITALWLKHCCHHGIAATKIFVSPSLMIYTFRWSLFSCPNQSRNLPFSPFWHYSPSGFTLACLMTNAHSLLPEVIVLHLSKTLPLKSSLISSIHLHLGIPFCLLICFTVTSLLSFHHPFLQHAQAIQISVL